MELSKKQVPVYMLEFSEDELMWLTNMLNKLHALTEKTLPQIGSNVDKEKLEALILTLESEL